MDVARIFEGGGVFICFKKEIYPEGGLSEIFCVFPNKFGYRSLV